MLGLWMESDAFLSISPWTNTTAAQQQRLPMPRVSLSCYRESSAPLLAAMREPLLGFMNDSDMVGLLVNK